MTQNRTLILALVLPWVILLGLFAYNTVARVQAQSWLLPVEGYDPRNLVYGHYVLARFKWPQTEAESPGCTGPDCCLCLGAENMIAQPFTLRYASRMDCALIPSATCTGHIALKNTLWDQGFKIYLAQEDGPVAEKYLRDPAYANRITVQTFIDTKGRLTLGDLHVDGVPIQAYRK